MRRNLTFVVGRADDLKIVETCLHRLMSTQINALGSWSVVKTMLDRRSLLTLVVLVNAWACPSAVPGGVNECSRRAPFFLTANQRIALCRESNTSAPAECARKAHTAPGLSASLILELCSGVTSDMPGVCVAGIPRRIAATLSSELRVELCRDADSDAPARCVQHSANSKRQPQLVVDICRGSSSVGPAECLDLLPRAASHDAAVSLCSRVQTVGPAVCANAPGQLKHGSELTARLCHAANGQGPADCFKQSAFVKRLSEDDRIELCRGATSDAPARCAGDIRDRSLSISDRLALCSGASGIAPAACLALAPPTVAADERVALCQGAVETSPAAPVLCLKKVPQVVPTTSAVALCRGAHDSTAAECAKAAHHIVGDSTGLLVLCQDAPSLAPAHCARAAYRVGAEKHLAAVLCASAVSLAPASCFAAAPKQIPPELRVETCAGARSNHPALCLEAAMPRGLQMQQSGSGSVCPLNPEAGSAPRRGLDYRLAARLCRDATDDTPAQCGRAAPMRMSDNDVETLCAADGLPSGKATSNCASAAMMGNIGLSSAARLCRGATSDAPAACAASVAPRIGEAKRIDICMGALNNTPARCANSISVVRTPSALEIAECRSAAPRPSNLHITNLGHKGDTLFPDQPMHATLEIRDQWEGEMPADSSTMVRASVALRGSNGASVSANGRFNASSDGVVHFSHICFTGAGSLTLQFSIDGNSGINVPLAAAHIVVAETEHGVSVRRCGRIFSQLSCPSGTAPPGWGTVDGTKGEYEPPVVTEAVSIVAGGAVAAWQVLSCQRVLEENGVKVAFLSGGKAPFSAWLWYHPGMEALETGAGLPTRQQPAWEILGVDRDTSARAVRRAYYRQSLLWHPDRWVRHAMHSSRAQEVFEIVGEAYAWMVAEAHSNRPEDEALETTGKF